MKKKWLLFVAGTIMLATITTAQPQQPPKPPNPEERLKHVSEKISKEITLTAAQKAKVETAYKEFFAEMEKLRDKKEPPPPPPPPVKKEDADRLSKVRDAKIKAALSEAQYKKYTEIEQSLRPPRPDGPGGKDGKQGPPPPGGKNE